jgi:hypothetical protein
LFHLHTYRSHHLNHSSLSVSSSTYIYPSFFASFFLQSFSTHQFNSTLSSTTIFFNKTYFQQPFNFKSFGVDVLKTDTAFKRALATLNPFIRFIVVEEVEPKDINAMTSLRTAREPPYT